MDVDKLAQELETLAPEQALEAVLGVAFHDVPQDGPAADGDHRLGNVVRHVADAGALAAAKDDHLHEISLILIRIVRQAAALPEMARSPVARPECSVRPSPRKDRRSPRDPLAPR